MMPDDVPNLKSNELQVWKAVQEELREIAWLATVIGGLSVAGVGLAVALAAA